jgi:hypothetical protein
MGSMMFRWTARALGGFGDFPSTLLSPFILYLPFKASVMLSIFVYLITDWGNTSIFKGELSIRIK